MRGRWALETGTHPQGRAWALGSGGRAACAWEGMAVGTHAVQRPGAAAGGGWTGLGGDGGCGRTVGEMGEEGTGLQLEEMNRIWRLLGKLRPRDSGKLQDRELLAAWLLVLEPYPYEEVRQSVADYFRHRNYWPDVTDIAKGCPSYTPPSTSGQEKWGQPALGRIREQEAWLDWFLGEEASEPPEQLEWTEVRDRHEAGNARHACPESEGSQP